MGNPHRGWLLLAPWKRLEVTQVCTCQGVSEKTGFTKSIGTAEY